MLVWVGLCGQRGFAFVICLECVCRQLSRYLIHSRVTFSRTFWYKPVLCVAYSTLSCAFLALIFVVQKENAFGLIAGVMAVIGFFAFMLLSTALELGAECTYPVAEGTSSGLLYMVGQVRCFLGVGIGGGGGIHVTRNSWHLYLPYTWIQLELLMLTVPIPGSS